MTDEDAERNAAADRDNPPAETAWLASGRVVQPAPKQAISIRLDADVLAWFRGLGPRYQSRMNAVLRAYVEHQKRKETTAADRPGSGA
ncbi:MAG TPA: BrnA antitoxin family protein [Gemmatimonadaceae bacterium]|nr:BrnA antitoxin family protein [Gemmatimonadaceae bacterium]